MTDLMAVGFSRYEIELNDALRNVALEIRSVELLDLVSYIHTEKFENIADIFHSARELYFRPRTLMFSYSGQVKLDWFGFPLVSLDLELHQGDLDIYFMLNIATLVTSVQFKQATLNGRPLLVGNDDIIFSNMLKQARMADVQAQRWQCSPDLT
jgi:hypothetical protein